MRKSFLQVGEAAVGDADHLARVDVDGRPLHGGQHRVGHVGGPGDAQELSAVGDRHDEAFRCAASCGGPQSNHLSGEAHRSQTTQASHLGLRAWHT